MNVEFRSRRMGQRFERGDAAVKAWGPDVGRRYVQRVGALFAAERIQDLFQVRAFDLHPLTGNRDGQHAMRLTGQMRLILTFEGDRHVTVEEVVDYHG
ncbi:MAG: type II toxin-antitoxin system RelE/ParE family toxin [Dehalococcoidia bacterium]